MRTAALITLTLILLSANSMAQTVKYDTLRDPENGQLTYRGTFGFKDLLSDTAFHWMQDGVNAYEPNAAATAYLKEHLGKYRLVIFMGTWCDDSHNLVPKLYKILTTIGYPTDGMQLYGVDRSKITGTQAEQKWKVLFVPSIIVLDGDKEVGRITESVDKSVEEDLGRMLGR